MTTETLIESLRSIAETLQPFIQETASGTREWDGSRYVEAEPKTPDPEARIWWSVLTTMAEMLEGQGAPAKARQLHYLRKELFGGMGSFAEFAIDESRFGEKARAANERLAEQRERMFHVLEGLEDAL
jgi:hypothetical protein